MMVTSGHGVRMQYDYTGDTAGMPGHVSPAHPRWLRLTRSGDTITGYDSADGKHWTQVGTVQLTGLPSTVQVGMFATSPGYTVIQNSFGGGSGNGGPAQATGVFDHVSLTGSAPGTWTGTTVGGGGPAGGPAGGGQGPGAGPGPGGGPGSSPYTHAGGTFTVTGSGDIAPVTPGPGGGLPTVTIGQSLVGVFLGLIAIVVVAAMFFSTEFRRGLIRTTLTATPRRGAVLAAKAVVIAAVAFVTGLVAVAVSIAVGVPREGTRARCCCPRPCRPRYGSSRRHRGHAGAGGGAGRLAGRDPAAQRRRDHGRDPARIHSVPVGPAQCRARRSRWWLLRLTPAAAVAIEQSIPRYPQVATVTSPIRGYYPLSPYAGFGVLCLWTAAAAWPWPCSCSGGGTHERRRADEPAAALATAAARGTSLTRALHAEWTKLRTVSGPAGCWWGSRC